MHDCDESVVPLRLLHEHGVEGLVVVGGVEEGDGLWVGVTVVGDLSEGDRRVGGGGGRGEWGERGGWKGWKG